MAATILQYEGSTVSPKDDAVMYQIFNGRAGVVRGCEITHLGTNQIRIGAGYIYMCGRLVKVEEETVRSPFAANEKGAAGEVILKLDLLSDAPAQLLARMPRQELIQTDINGDGAVYEYLLASYTVTDVAVSGLKTEYEMAPFGLTEAAMLGNVEKVEDVSGSGYLVDAVVIREIYKNMKFALTAREYVLTANGWEENQEKGEYEGYYVQKKSASIGARNLLTAARPSYMLNEEAVSDLGSAINAEVYFSMLSMEASESGGTVQYKFLSRQKPPIDIPVLVRGV